MLLRLVAACALAVSLSAQGRLEYKAVKRELVQERLHRVARKNPERELTLWRMFEEAGCAGDRLAEQRVKGSRLPNLICTLPGETSAVIVVGGHFDTDEQGLGAVDNWSGASLLPSFYEALATGGRRHTFVFVGFTGEEAGLVGSRFYVRQLSREQKSSIRAMINLDCLGLSGTKIWLNGSDRTLAEMLARVAAAIGAPLAIVNADRVGTTDSASFADKKIPTVNLHSVTQAKLAILHGPKDRLDAIGMDDYYQTYVLVSAYLTYLDKKLD
jgi:Zn-dependent M28 family amino/carboxypeptidase